MLDQAGQADGDDEKHITWADLYLPDQFSTLLVGPGHLLAAGWHRDFYSLDRGDTWSMLPMKGLENVWKSSALAENKSFIFRGTQQGGVWRIPKPPGW